jgi:REP element-mobilizing transposase RayT
MPGTYSHLVFHIVFSTKGREPHISLEVADRLYPFIGGIVRHERGVLLAIGGVEDHIHLLISWRPDGDISGLMRNIKSRSSAWIHETFPALRHFSWQEGYSVFGVSSSMQATVDRYIRNQAEHHKTVDFRSELIELLKRHGIEYKPEYVFD